MESLYALSVIEISIKNLGKKPRFLIMLFSMNFKNLGVLRNGELPLAENKNQISVESKSRKDGDTPNPRGGVRGVISGKWGY